MLVVSIVQFAAKSTQKTAMYFLSEMDRKWRQSNKSRNVIGHSIYTRLWRTLLAAGNSSGHRALIEQSNAE